MSDGSPISVLFLCNQNAARSVMAEALLNAVGGDRFRAFSAGSDPISDGKVDPLTLAALESAGLPTEGLRSKSWNEFASSGAPHMDLVVTLCDKTAGETCPVWPGHPATAHWSYPDPRAASTAEDPHAFVSTLHDIRRHIDLLVNLRQDGVDRLVLESEARNWAPRRD